MVENASLCENIKKAGGVMGRGQASRDSLSSTLSITDKLHMSIIMDDETHIHEP